MGVYTIKHVVAKNKILGRITEEMQHRILLAVDKLNSDFYCSYLKRDISGGVCRYCKGNKDCGYWRPLLLNDFKLI